MKQGQILYQGPIAGGLETIEAAGFPCPKYTNPADHLLDVLSLPAALEAGLDDILLSKQQEATSDIDIQTDLLVKEAKLSGALSLTNEYTSNLSWWKQFKILFHRSMKEQWRLKDVFFTQLAQSILMAVLIGTVFLRIGTGQPSTVRRNAVLFFCAVNQVS
jgi:hypothetical protein